MIYYDPKTGNTLTLDQARARLPNVSFAVGTDLSHFGLFKLMPTEPPKVPPTKEVRAAAPVLLDGQWRQAWQVAEKSGYEIRQYFVAEIEKRLNSFAQQRGYDDIKSACDYVGCPVAKYDEEGRTCRDLRALTWEAATRIFDDITAGRRPMPEYFSEIEGELPPMLWADQSAP